jgi:hypothetical protein
MQFQKQCLVLENSMNYLLCSVFYQLKECEISLQKRDHRFLIGEFKVYRLEARMFASFFLVGRWLINLNRQWFGTF